MAYIIAIQNPCRYRGIPSTIKMRQWAKLILRKYGDKNKQGEICIRIVDENESSKLNHTYRQRANPTNILSFPYEVSEDAYLGDIAICAPLVEKEAIEQNKTLEAHWAHLIIHGVLHLLGFDHMTEKEAHHMEQIEILILNELGYTNPYGEH